MDYTADLGLLRADTHIRTELSSASLDNLEFFLIKIRYSVEKTIKLYQ